MLLLAGFLTITSSNQENYVEIQGYTHSSTKAICTEDNFCQDYEIFCENSEVISIAPITGAVVQFSEDWQDPRPNEIRNKFC